MSKPYQNQHYVSRVLLNRFANDDGFLHRFSFKANGWKQVSSKQVFSSIGYTQLLAFGQNDNSLEDSFKSLEDIFPKTLEALDDAATRPTTELPKEIYHNLFSYCAYLWGLSPFKKSVAPAEFAIQLDADLKHGRTELLKAIGIHENNFPAIFNLHAKGTKFILNASLQLMHRVHFNCKIQEDYRWLRGFPKWKLYRSPIELPVSDVAFFRFHDQPSNVMVLMLPISPNLALVGTLRGGVQIQESFETRIHSDTMTQDEAEYFIQAICLSGVTAVAAKSRAYDVLALRQKASERGIRFAKIKNLDEVLSSGTKHFNGPLILVPTTQENYVHFLKAFVEQ